MRFVLPACHRIELCFSVLRKRCLDAAGNRVIREEYGFLRKQGGKIVEVPVAGTSTNSRSILTDVYISANSRCFVINGNGGRTGTVDVNSCRVSCLVKRRIINDWRSTEVDNVNDK